jgi:hypothetical protein
MVGQRSKGGCIDTYRSEIGYVRLSTVNMVSIVYW